MANTFNSALFTGLPTGAITVYTVPASTTTTVIGFSLANKSGAAVTVTAQILRAGVTYAIISGASIPAGSSLIVVGFEQKIVLKANDELQASCTTSGVVDAIVSVLEQV